MRRYRSSSSSAAALALAGALLLAPAGQTGAGEADPPGAAPTGVGSPPEATAPARECPRCGYRCERSWTFCLSCGWDLRTPTGEAVSHLLGAIGRSVVGVIATYPEEVDPTLEAILKKYHATVTGRPGETRGFATGFALEEAGLFLTSATFLQGAREIQVRTHTNHILPATVAGIDAPSGVGLIRADVPGAIRLAARDDPALPGEGAWSICMPVIVEDDLVNLVRYWPQSFHKGRLTATGQSGTGLVAFEDLIRSDHSVPRMCRGAPLLDLRGSVIGMVAGSPDTGLTYAVPVRQVLPVAEILARNETPRRPYFGLGLVALDDWRRARFDIDKDAAHPLIPYVIPGSPAESARVRGGDLLTAVDGEAVGSVAEAGSRFLKAAPGGPAVRLGLRRGGQNLDVTVTPVERPARIFLAPIDELREALEITLDEVTTGPTSQHGLRVVDLAPGGRGDKAGYRRGDTIVSVNERAVRRFETFDQIVRSEAAATFAKEATYPTYRLGLDVRTGSKDKESRPFRSLHPGTLLPPVY